MMMYRTIHDVQRRMPDLTQSINAAILADDTRDIASHGGAAMTIIDDVLHTLRDALDHEGTSLADEQPEVHLEQRFVQAAADAFTVAWNYVEAIGGGTDVSSMRASMVDGKTHADYAVAYLTAALGEQRE